MDESPVERKLAAILAADVAGYSRLMGLDETGTLATLSSHRKVIDELIRQRNGRIANTAGDSILAEFPSVIEAVQCGVEIQQAMMARNSALPEASQMLLRIGINVGDVMVKDEDIFGDGVNVAARLQGLAAVGGICISRAVRDQLRDKSPFVFEDQGEQAVKNIARPVRVFTVRFEGQPGVTTSVGAEMLPAENAPTTGPIEEAPPQADEIELAFWDSITDSESASDYSAYLERYPMGNFSALARARLTGLASGEAGGNGDNVKLEMIYWQSVIEGDDPDMFRSYLEKYPDGHFKELAEARLRKFERNEREDN